ncbi:hypothetical protein [Kitasatospora paranensis]|uniref:Uncharacterized protein n=1 Tax=Kitasatospora paranensis TaxID=258053 RepID=A0ABW2G815_9ACTN
MIDRQHGRPWLQSDNLAGTWSSFRSGRTTAMTCVAQVGGVPFLLPVVGGVFALLSPGT